MKEMFKYCTCRCFTLNIPTVADYIFNLGSINDVTYIFESIQGTLIFYIAIYGLDIMKKYAINHSEYKDSYEKILTRERADLFIKFISFIQLLFIVMLVVLPIELLKYTDMNSILLFFSITSFILSFVLGSIYLFKIRNKKYM